MLRYTYLVRLDYQRPHGAGEESGRVFGFRTQHHVHSRIPNNVHAEKQTIGGYGPRGHVHRGPGREV